MFRCPSVLCLGLALLLANALAAQETRSKRVTFNQLPVNLRVSGTAVQGYLVEVSERSITYINARGRSVEVDGSKVTSIRSLDGTVTFNPKFEDYKDFVARMSGQFGQGGETPPESVAQNPMATPMPATPMPENPPTFNNPNPNPTPPGIPRPNFGQPPTPNIPSIPRPNFGAPAVPEGTTPPSSIPPATPNYNQPPTQPPVMNTTPMQPPGMNMPPVQTPNMNMPQHQMPTMPASNFDPTANMPTAPMYQEVKICSSCNKELPSHLTAGDSCPHCGVHFDYDETNGKRSSPGMIGSIVGGIVALIAIGVRIVRALGN